MDISFFGDDPTSGRSLDIAFHNQKRLVYFLNGSSFFAYRSSNGGESYRSSFEFMNNRRKDFIIHFVQSTAIYIQCFESKLCDFYIDGSISFDLSKIPNSPQ